LKIYIHVGYAKCGSTSLQESLRESHGVFYPSAGTNLPAAEHISLPLYLKGIDAYTKQFISDEWVHTQHALMMEQIAKADRPVFLSSERLASLSRAQIDDLRDLFPGHDVEIIFIVRDRDKYINSTWRHAVFYHDYAVDYSSFQKKMAQFDFMTIVPMFQRHFPVHMFNLDDENFERSIMDVIGTKFQLSTANVGVPNRLAELLQEQHVLFGSYLFKEVFTRKAKQKMLFMMTCAKSRPLDPFDIPLF
jgi:hypothetical protein